MLPSDGAFRRSICRQIRLNQARTPGERLDALCDLIDAARSLAQTDDAAQHRRRAVSSTRAKDKEQWREQCRRFLAAERIDAQDGAEPTGEHAGRPADID
jgi:hypothetical protein